MKIPKILLGSELAAILYCDDIVTGDGRFLRDRDYLPTVAKCTLQEGGNFVRLDGSVSVSGLTKTETRHGQQLEMFILPGGKNDP